MTVELNKFVQDLAAACKENLVSVILYGSKASGEDTKNNSDYNTLVVLKNADYPALVALQPPVVSWTKAGNTPPLILTLDDISGSADVFPIEFYDIKDHHEVLFGQDVIKDAVIHDKHLRHQCEFELKSKLLALRQRYIAASGSPEKVRAILTGTASSFLVLFRHVVRLLGEQPPKHRLDALDMLHERAGISQSVFVTIMKIRNGEKDAAAMNPELLMKQYIEVIEKVIAIIDKLPS